MLLYSQWRKYLKVISKWMFITEAGYLLILPDLVVKGERP